MQAWTQMSTCRLLKDCLKLSLRHSLRIWKSFWIEKKYFGDSKVVTIKWAFQASKEKLDMTPGLSQMNMGAIWTNVSVCTSIRLLLVSLCHTCMNHEENFKILGALILYNLIYLTLILKEILLFLRRHFQNFWGPVMTRVFRFGTHIRTRP